MAEVLFVSKPVVPPWHDSSKNLVRTLASAMRRHQPLIMGRRDEGSALAGVTALPVYRRPGAFAPGARDQVGVLTTLMASRRGAVWHFFFAPNLKSSTVGRWATRLRRRPTVHTVCSAPRQGAELERLLFADRTVVLSEATRRRLVEGGVAPASIARVPPAIEPLTALTEERRREVRRELDLPDGPLYVFPGDLEFGSGGRIAIEALRARPEAHLVMACRAKTPAALEAERALRDQAQTWGLSSRITWVGETPRIHDLLGCADVVTLLSETLYAKMDYPLVLLEAMSLEVPVLVAEDTPAAELADGGGLAARGAGALPVDAEALAAALGRLFADGDARAAAGRAGAAHVLGEHAPAAMAAAYEAIYDEVLARGHAPRAGR